MCLPRLFTQGLAGGEQSLWSSDTFNNEYRLQRSRYPNRLHEVTKPRSVAGRNWLVAQLQSWSGEAATDLSLQLLVHFNA